MHAACSVFVPPYWTNPTQIVFNFSNFQDPESGISQYLWGVGNGTSYPPTVITLRNFTGPNVTVDMAVGDRDFPNLVLHQVNYTPPGKTLIDGMDYRVFVQAINMGVPRTSTTIMSDQIEVSSDLHASRQCIGLPLNAPEGSPHNEILQILSMRCVGITQQAGRAPFEWAHKNPARWHEIFQTGTCPPCFATRCCYLWIS